MHDDSLRPKLNGNVIPIRIARRQHNPIVALLDRSRSRTRCITIVSKENNAVCMWQPMSIRRALKLKIEEKVCFIGTNNRRCYGVVITSPTILDTRDVEVKIACNGIGFADVSNGRTMTRLLEPENAYALEVNKQEIEAFVTA